jgi:hypothetical protein
MQHIRAHNFQKAVQIVHESSRHNPLFTLVAGNGTDRDRVLYYLSKFNIEKAQTRKGAFITHDLENVMLLYESNSDRWRLQDVRPTAELLVKGTGVIRSVALLRCRMKLRQRRREGRFLYLQLMTALGNQKDLQVVNELQQAAIDRSEFLQLPLITETAVWQDKVYYEGLGFETYHSYQDNTGVTVWFLQRMPGRINSL